MTPFEEQLKEALARREPPEGFTNRVLQRTTQRMQDRTADKGWRWRRSWVWRLAPAMLALLLASGAIYHEHQQTARGEEAKEKLLTAVRIAGSKLQETRQHVIEIEGTEVER